MRNQGSVNFLGLAMIIGIAAGIYFVVMLAPAYTDNMDVQEALAAAYNSSNRGDQVMRNVVREKLRYVGTHKEDDGYGNEKEVQGMGFSDDDVVIDRDDVNNTVTVRIDYVREVELKPFHKILTLHFHPIKSGPSK